MLKNESFSIFILSKMNLSPYIEQQEEQKSVFVYFFLMNDNF